MTGWSPVTMITRTPADRHRPTASAASSRGGSAEADQPQQRQLLVGLRLGGADAPFGEGEDAQALLGQGMDPITPGVAVGIGQVGVPRPRPARRGWRPPKHRLRRAL